MTPAELGLECDRYRRDGARTVALVHLSSAGSAAVITEESLDGEDVSARLQQLAADDAADAGTVATYAVIFRDDRGREMGRRKWRVMGRGFGELEPTEPAAREGVLAQVMRHDEMHVRIGVETQVRTVQHLIADSTRQDQRHERELARIDHRHALELERLERMLAAQHARIGELEAREGEIRGRFDESEDRRAVREITLRDEIKGMERRDRLLSQLEPVIPTILARMLPSAGARNGASAGGAALEVAALDAFLGSIEEQQLEGLAAQLSEGQRLGFIQLMKASWTRKEVATEAAAEKKRQEDAAVAGRPTTTTTPTPPKVETQ